MVVIHPVKYSFQNQTGSIQEKEQANLGDSKKPKSPDVFPLSNKPQLKPEAAFEPDVLPKSLRVPPGLEDYMATEKLGKGEVVRCLHIQYRYNHWADGQIKDPLQIYNEYPRPRHILADSPRASANIAPFSSC